MMANRLFTTDVDGDDMSLQVDERAATIVRRDDGVVLQDHRVAVTATAELAAHAVLHVDARSRRPALQFRMHLALLAVALGQQHDRIARLPPRQLLDEVFRFAYLLAVHAAHDVPLAQPRTDGRRIGHDIGNAQSAVAGSEAHAQVRGFRRVRGPLARCRDITRRHADDPDGERILLHSH
jgi:hypothetical protein